MYRFLSLNSCWMIGRHSKLRFWYDNWVDKPIVDVLPSDFVVSNPDLLVSQVFAEDLSWNLDIGFK